MSALKFLATRRKLREYRFAHNRVYCVFRMLEVANICCFVMHVHLNHQKDDVTLMHF